MHKIQSIAYIASFFSRVSKVRKKIHVKPQCSWFQIGAKRFFNNAKDFCKAYRGVCRTVSTIYDQKQPPEVFYRKTVLKNFALSIGQH